MNCNNIFPFLPVSLKLVFFFFAFAQNDAAAYRRGQDKQRLARERVIAQASVVTASGSPNTFFDGSLL
jgi:hypothetical protein